MAVFAAIVAVLTITTGVLLVTDETPVVAQSSTENFIRFSFQIFLQCGDKRMKNRRGFNTSAVFSFSVQYSLLSKTFSGG